METRDVKIFTIPTNLSTFFSLVCDISYQAVNVKTLVMNSASQLFLLCHRSKRKILFRRQPPALVFL